MYTYFYNLKKLYNYLAFYINIFTNKIEKKIILYITKIFQIFFSY
jgi:hypothetical protein